jgi:hypothetical protein
VTTRPFVTARRAAELLGTTEAAVIEDVRANSLYNLNGGPMGETWIVYAYELEGERLAMHQARFARHADRESDSHA